MKALALYYRRTSEKLDWGICEDHIVCKHVTESGVVSGLRYPSQPPYRINRSTFARNPCGKSFFNSFITANLYYNSQTIPPTCLCNLKARFHGPDLLTTIPNNNLISILLTNPSIPDLIPEARSILRFNRHLHNLALSLL